MAIDIDDFEEEVFFDVVAEFNQELARGGCTVSPGLFKKIGELFGETVGAAIGKDKTVWTESAKRYVLRVVRRIARETCETAHQKCCADITAEVLDEVARDIIVKENMVCTYAKSVKVAAKASDKWKRVPWGIFCPMA